MKRRKSGEEAMNVFQCPLGNDLDCPLRPGGSRGPGTGRDASARDEGRSQFVPLEAGQEPLPEVRREGPGAGEGRSIPNLLWRCQEDDFILVLKQDADGLPFRGLEKAKPGQKASTLLKHEPGLFEELKRCAREKKNRLSQVRRRVTATGLEQEFLLISIFIPPDLVQIVPHDVTEAESIRRALRESEQMYRNVYENLRVGLSRNRIRDGGFLLANQALAEMLGYDSAKQLMADPLSGGAYLGETRLKDLSRRRTRKRRLNNLEIETARKDGERLVLNLSVTFFPQEGYFETVAIGVTEQKQAQEALKRSEGRLRLLSAELLSAQESERKQIARELHDGIGQSLAAIRYGVEAVDSRMPSGLAEETHALLAALPPMIQSVTDEVRTLYENLRPPVLDDLGLLASISWFLRKFQSIYTHLRIDRRITLREDQIPEALKIVLFRILQEALNNVARHAAADRVAIGLKRTQKRLVLTIADNGRGFDPEEPPSGRTAVRGMGLAAMRERTELSGGGFSLSSAPGRGTRIRAEWPAGT
jgi:PAS domain S-box-containing protein